MRKFIKDGLSRKFGKTGGKILYVLFWIFFVLSVIPSWGIIGIPKYLSIPVFLVLVWLPALGVVVQSGLWVWSFLCLLQAEDLYGWFIICYSVSFAIWVACGLVPFIMVLRKEGLRTMKNALLDKLGSALGIFGYILTQLLSIILILIPILPTGLPWWIIALAVILIYHFTVAGDIATMVFYIWSFIIMIRRPFSWFSAVFFVSFAVYFVFKIIAVVQTFSKNNKD